MILNDRNSSTFSQQTHRTLLLDKRIEPHQETIVPKKEEIFDVIRDKALCIDFQTGQIVQRSLYRFYQRFKLIRPQNPFIVLWNILIMVIIIFYLLEFPLILGYGQVVWNDISTYFLPVVIIFQILLAVDIFLTPLKMRYREGLLIRDRRILIKEYLGCNFWIDVIGLLSIVIPLIFKDYYGLNIMKVLFLPKVITLSQLDDKIVNVLVFQVKTKMLYLIARLIVFTLMISHYIGIGFYLVGYYIYSTNYYGPNTPNICWLYNAEAYSQIILLLDWKGQYAYTMYFSLGMTTTIAYGDITPLNPIETLYIVFALVINTLAFGYILSQVMRILIQAFYAEFDKNNIKYTMENILVGRKIKPKLRQLIRGHMQKIAKEQMYRDRKIERQIISSLPFNLQISLYTKIYYNFIQSLKISPEQFFTDKNRNSQFLDKIVLEIIESRYLAGDLIYKEKQIFTEEFNNHKTYFLKDEINSSDIILGVGKSPSINLETHMVENEHQYMIFYNGRVIFGQVEFFTGYPRSHWIISRNNLLMYELSRNSLLKNLRYATRRQLEYLTELRQKISDSYCYICFGQHNFKKCSKTSLIFNVLEAVNRASENQKMKRRHNSRIQNIRTEKRITSAKTNALGIFKTVIKSKERKALQKTKIRLLASSKHYRRIYYQNDTSSQRSSDSSSHSSEDLDFMIHETKMLIQNFNKVGGEEISQEIPIFEFQFDLFYEFKGYKPKDNYEMVLNKLSNLQKILMSKRKLLMK